MFKPRTHHSRYNYVVAIPKSTDCLVYNFNTGALLRLSKAQKLLFDLAPQFSQDHPVVKRWRELGFLSNSNELEDLKSEVRARYDDYAGRTDKVLRLTLHVTSLCNFACPYCFQERRSAHMLQEVQDQVVLLTEAKLGQGGYERMTVDWFGGEPLLAAHIIDDLGHRLMDVAAQHKAGFSSNIHTNAYLLDQAMVDLLEGVNCRFAIVTLDGYGPDHDKTRHLHGGGATFERILTNLSAIKTNMVLNIRSNLHADNFESYEKLQAAIGAIAKSTGNEMRCSPALVHTSSAGFKRGDPTIHLLSGEYHKILGTTDLEERSNTYTPKLFNCHVVQLDNYLIDDEGYLFPHCNELAANRDFAYGNILDLDEGGLGRLDELHMAQCLEYVLPTQDEECMQCELLTVCYGGCLLARLGAKSSCMKNPERIDAYLLKKAGISSQTKVGR
ncbi:MAG: radical SAM protein [Atopobiaceae bacterium]|nr:radical SAM protein [Atopobiaceae bacterium]